MSQDAKRIRSLYASTLEPRLEALEGFRRELTSIVGSLFTLWWLVRVRRVVIRPEVVLIWRGLRPFPRRYRRPPSGRAVRIDKAVYVGKVGSSFPINPSASPILRSEEEAKWIASEMRRAFRVT